ncbi:pancreatic lipase-related 2-like, partial [Paramuricea clavata]
MAHALDILKVTLLLIIAARKDVVATSSGSSNSDCYSVYGTFGNAAPFDNPLVFSKAPECVSVIDTSFKLYNKAKPAGVVLDNTNPVTSDITAGNKIVVLVHGLSTTGGHDESMYSAMRPELLAKKNSNNQEYLNVITVDWTGGVKVNDLQQSFGNARLVSAQISYFLKKLESRGKLSCGDVHIIGFSLGASVAGLAGKRLKAQSCQIPRITGLDPVLYNYESIFRALPNGAKLHRSDATYVDVIHTHTRFSDRVGNADFFPNGGQTQPGCGTSTSA